MSSTSTTLANYRRAVSGLGSRTQKAAYRTGELRQVATAGAALGEFYGLEIEPDLFKGQELADGSDAAVIAAQADLKAIIGKVASAHNRMKLTPELLRQWWIRHCRFMALTGQYTEASRPAIKAKKLKHAKGCDPRIDDAVACVVKTGGIKPDQEARQFLNVKNLKESGRRIIRPTGKKLIQQAENLYGKGYISEPDEREAAEAIEDTITGQPVYSTEQEISQADESRLMDEIDEEIRTAAYLHGLPPGWEKVPF